MVLFPSRKQHHCLLLTNPNSTAPKCADEFVFAKYPYLLSNSTQRVEKMQNIDLSKSSTEIHLTNKFVFIHFCYIVYSIRTDYRWLYL